MCAITYPCHWQMLIWLYIVHKSMYVYVSQDAFNFVRIWECFDFVFLLLFIQFVRESHYCRRLIWDTVLDLWLKVARAFSRVPGFSHRDEDDTNHDAKPLLAYSRLYHIYMVLCIAMVNNCSIYMQYISANTSAWKLNEVRLLNLLRYEVFVFITSIAFLSLTLYAW